MCSLSVWVEGGEGGEGRRRGGEGKGEKGRRRGGEGEEERGRREGGEGGEEKKRLRHATDLVHLPVKKK